MKNFSSALAQVWLPKIRLIATDMDGTLTWKHRFDSRLLQRFEALQARGIQVLVVTGRSAGWVSALVEYLPIAGAIAENGGYWFSPTLPTGKPLVHISDPWQFRQNLQQVFEQLQRHYPQIQTSNDNRFRLSDWTFDNIDLSPEVLASMGQWCEQAGWSFTYSSIQCHIKPAGQSKQQGLIQVLQDFFPTESAQTSVLTLGDSPNDADLLDAKTFPYSVGVANITPYLVQMTTQPTWVSQHPELLGFLEVTEGLLN